MNNSVPGTDHCGTAEESKEPILTPWDIFAINYDVNKSFVGPLSPYFSIFLNKKQAELVSKSFLRVM